MAEAVETAITAFGGIDILLNNAGITSVEFMMRDGMIHELDVDLWDQTMAVNVRGYMLCTKHALPSMLARGGGVIVNTASGADMQAESTRPAYGTSKAAVIGFTRNVATQYGKVGIRCVAVVPGLVLTPTVAANMPPPMIEMMRRHHLTAQIPGPEDVANVMVFLASDRAAFVTGSAISVDGGFSIHGPSYADDMAMWAAVSGAEGAALADRSAVPSRPALERASARTTPRCRGHPGPRCGLAGSGESSGSRPGQGRSDCAPGTRSRTRALGSRSMTSSTPTGSTPWACSSFRRTAAPTGMPCGRRTSSTRRTGRSTELWSLPARPAVLSAFADGSPVPEHANTARFRAAEEARARNVFSPDDMAAINEYLRDDVHWNSPGAGAEQP